MRKKLAPVNIVVVICIIIGLCWPISQTSAAVRSPCPRAIRTSTNYHYRGELHFICLQLEPNSPPRLDVIQFRTSQLVWSTIVNEPDTNQLASFVDNEGTLRILLAVPNKINGTSMYSVDQAGRGLDERHTVNTQLVSTMAIWKLELTWQWHLVIANRRYLDPNAQTKTPPPNESGKKGPIITFHSWRHTYFNRYDSIDTLPESLRINKLEPMHIYDQELLIVATEPSNPDHIDPKSGLPSYANSFIYKLDFTTGSLKWEEYQVLKTAIALDASSFLITHKNSVQLDHYIALVGQLQPSDNVDYRTDPRLVRHEPDSLSHQHGLIIYKFFGDHFVVTNSIPVAGATRLDTISYGHGDSYVVLALLSGWPNQQINLFLFDGLNLKPLPGPNINLGPPRPGSMTPNRYRRTMDTSNLNLIRVPPNDLDSQTYDKRNLEATTQDTSLPALVFSSMSDAHSGPNGDSRLNAATDKGDNRESMYQIPVLEHIEAYNQDAAHVKRNFAGQYQRPDGGSSSQFDMDLLGWCRLQLGTLLNDKFDSIAQQLSSLPRIDQNRPIVIDGDLEIAGNLHMKGLLYAQQIIDQSGNQARADYLLFNESQSFLNDISQVDAEISELKYRAGNVLLGDGKRHDIHVPLRFQRITIQCNSEHVNPAFGLTGCPHVGEIRTPLMNGRNVSDIQRQALVTGRAMVVGQEVRFEHLVLRGQTNILQTLNKLPIDEIIFGRGRKPIGPIFGHKNFLGGLYSSANVIVDNWNGAHIDRQTVLTGTGEQRIDAKLRFSEIVLDSNIYNPANYSMSSRIEYLNGLHLDTHLSQIAQVNEDNRFEMPISFDELVINGPAYLPAGSTLSGVNLESLWASTLFGHSNQNISAHMEFRNVLVSYGGDIQVEGLINGLILTPNNVMMRDRKYELDNPFVFESDLSVRLLYVEKALNGIQVFPNTDTNQLELAILYDGGKQIITGDKIFNEVRLGGRSNIGGLINGHLDLAQLNTLARNNGQPFRFGNVRLARRLVRVADNVKLHIESLVNGVHVNQICSLANSLATPQIQMRQYDRLKFDHQPIRFKQLRCASINGYNDLRNHFMMRFANQRVAGTLRLVNGAIFNSTINVGATFNNLNIEPLARSIAQVLNESRTSHKDFHQDLYIDSLNAVAINDLHLSRVFLAKSDLPQVISAPMSFDHLDIENVLVIGRDLQTQSFNGLNVSEIMTNTLQYDAPQVIYNHVELDNMQILPGSNLYTKSLNGYDLNSLYSDAVLVDVPQQILAPKNFKGLTEMTNRIALNFGIDGLSERELKFNLLVQSDELIEDDVEFENDVTIMKSLEIQTGQIDDQDVNRFVESMISEDGGSKGGMRVVDNSSIRFHDVRLNNLVLTGLIQNHRMPQDAIQKSDQLNSSFAALIREEQIRQNNQQLLNKLYETGSPFRIQTLYRNQTLGGFCQIHSCPPTTPIISLQPRPGPTRPPAQPLISQPVSHPLASPLMPAPWLVTRPPLPGPPRYQPPPRAQPPRYRPLPEPIVYFKPLEPFLRPRPLTIVNASAIPKVWTPIRPPIVGSGGIPTNDTHFNYQQEFPLVDRKYLEYQAYLKTLAIKELAIRVNQLLPISFYYEIAQKHPAMGLALHAAESPIPGEQGYALLLFKEASKLGEPCSIRRQGVAVSSLQRRRGGVALFTQFSVIQDTFRPQLVESLVVGDRYHYLFVADIVQVNRNSTSVSQISIYIWNHQSGMYDVREQKRIDGFPVAMRAFVLEDRLGCIALAEPGLIQVNSTGAPVLYCQDTFLGQFSRKIVLNNMRNIIDLDIVPLPATGFGSGRSGSGQIMIAALAQRDSNQVGDLLISRFDVQRNFMTNLLMRRISRPIKVHFVKRSARVSSSTYDLVVSGGVTSNENAEAITRIISLGVDGSVRGTKVIRDNQFVDVQSVLLDDFHSMIFMQSTNAISIYAPLNPSVVPTDFSCPSDTYQLIQRLPTKGANKFLVFNSLTNKYDSNRHNVTRTPFDHFLVLSTNDCEHQHYSTVVLKPHFR